MGLPWLWLPAHCLGGECRPRTSLHGPVGVHETGIDIDIFTDARLIFPTPASRCLAAGFVKCAGEMMNRLKADLGGYFLEWVVRILNKFLGLLNTVLQQIAARRNSQGIFEVLADMPIGPPDHPRTCKQAAVFGMVLANELRGLLNDPIARERMLDLLVRANLRLRVVAAKIANQKLRQKQIAEFAVKMAFALAFVPDAFE